MRSTPAQPAPRSLCSPFVDAFPVSGASISVFGWGGQQSTICSTDRLAARVETLQFELGEGPHWEALKVGAPVLCPDLLAAASWPVFSTAAQDLGVRAVFAFPMKLGAAVVGVVDLYCLSPQSFNAQQTSLATSMADRTAAAAVNRATRSANDHVVRDNETTPALRREVHQATGIIQVQLDTNATEAFTRLRAYAFSSGRGVDDVARDVVSRALDFNELPEEFDHG